MSSEPQAVTHQAMEVRHRDELEWETIRWPGETGKMMFHPRPERPTEPNAGILKLEPGGHHPLHKHDFAQVWYVLEGTFKIGAHECGPGSMIFHPDPHFEDEFRTETGGEILIVPWAEHRRPADLRRSVQPEGTQDGLVGEDRSVASRSCCRTP